jgi:hypothetical protein
MKAPLVRGCSKKSLFGCTPLEFRAHIEYQFRGEMGWENYGKLWEIDHVVRVSRFNLPKEIFSCFHYTNLRPRIVSLNRIDILFIPKTPRIASLTKQLTAHQESSIE